MDIPPDDEHARFTALFHSTSRRVRAYASRHVPAGDVDEVVAETYAIAWRRRDRIDHDDPVPWLLVTARNHIANRRRHRGRSEQAHPDLASIAAAVPSAEGPVVERSAALAALATLTAREREAVLLIAWDGLDQTTAARVAGCSVRAFTVRLHRARARLTRELDPPPEPDRVRAAAPVAPPRPAPRPVVVKDLS